MRCATRRRAPWIGLALVALLGVSASGVNAQSLFNSMGIGTPQDAMDARSVVLGDMGIGLMGGDLLPTDPAAAADLVLPTMVITARPSWTTFSRSKPSESGSFQRTYFPLMGIAYPIPHVGVATVSFSSVLDQRYEVKKQLTIPLYDTTMTVGDGFHSQGGVSAVRVGLARTIGSMVSVGLDYGRYTGSTRRTLQRTFPLDTLIATYTLGGYWTYSGSVVSGGASVQFGALGRLAGSVTWSSKLTATPSSTTETGGGTYDIPVQFRLGGSAMLLRGVMLTAGVAHANWNVKGATYRDGSVGSATTDFGLGVELSQTSLFGRRSPVRVGYHRTELPFSMPGEGQPIESAFSAGIGLALRKSVDYTLAGVDFTLERGTRQDNSLTEHFWRADMTLRVTGL